MLIQEALVLCWAFLEKKNPQRSIGNTNKILNVEAGVRHASQHPCASLSYTEKAIISAGTELWS